MACLFVFQFTPKLPENRGGCLWGGVPLQKPQWGHVGDESYPHRRRPDS